MHTLIVILHILVCLFMMVVILLQPGKGGDMSAAFGGGGGSQTVFGARGATSFLQKLTSYVAVLYMVTTITLAWYSNENLHTGSVIDDASIQEFQKEQSSEPELPALPTSGAAEETGVKEDGAHAPKGNPSNDTVDDGGASLSAPAKDSASLSAPAKDSAAPAGEGASAPKSP